MANIDSYLEAIKKAIYGEQVRGSIHDAIKAINDGVDESLIEIISAYYDPTQVYGEDYAYCTYRDENGLVCLYEYIGDGLTTGEFDPTVWQKVTLTDAYQSFIGGLKSVYVYEFASTQPIDWGNVPIYAAADNILSRGNNTIILYDTNAHGYYFLDSRSQSAITFANIDIANRIIKRVILSPGLPGRAIASAELFLPSTTSSDSGKVLTVNSSGVWEPQTPSSGNERSVYIYDFSSEGVTQSAPQLVDYDSDINYTNIMQLLATRTKNVILYDTYSHAYYFLESLTTGSITFRMWDYNNRITYLIVVPNGSTPMYIKQGNILIPGYSGASDAGKVLSIDSTSWDITWKSVGDSIIEPITISYAQVTRNHSFKIGDYAFIDFELNTPIPSGNSVIGGWDLKLPLPADLASGSYLPITCQDVSDGTYRKVGLYNSSGEAYPVGWESSTVAAAVRRFTATYKLATS